MITQSEGWSKTVTPVMNCMSNAIRLSSFAGGVQAGGWNWAVISEPPPSPSLPQPIRGSYWSIGYPLTGRMKLVLVVTHSQVCLWWFVIHMVYSLFLWFIEKIRNKKLRLATTSSWLLPTLRIANSLLRTFSTTKQMSRVEESSMMGK